MWTKSSWPRIMPGAIVTIASGKVMRWDTGMLSRRSAVRVVELGECVPGIEGTSAVTLTLTSRVPSSSARVTVRISRGSRTTPTSRPAKPSDEPDTTYSPGLTF